MAHGQPWQVNGARECLERLMEHPLWKSRDEWKASSGKDGAGLRGTGMAVGGWVPGIQPTSAIDAAEPGRHADGLDRRGRHRRARTRAWR